MFGLSWTQIWALVSRASEMTALATDVAQVINKHRPVIDHVLDTLDKTPDKVGHNPEVVEHKAKAKVIDVMTRSTSNVDNN